MTGVQTCALPISSLPQLSGREIRLGLLYLLSELLVIPPIIYGIGDLLGGFSPAFANFLYYLCNAGFCLLIFRELLAQSLRQAGSRPLRFLLAALVGFAGFELSAELNQFLLRYLAPDFFNVNDASLRGMIMQADRKSTRLNSSHLGISYAVFCL